MNTRSFGGMNLLDGQVMRTVSEARRWSSKMRTRHPSSISRRTMNSGNHSIPCPSRTNLIKGVIAATVAFVGKTTS
jgi:hypothetical protein